MSRCSEILRTGNVEEAAFAIEALFQGSPEDDPDASFVGAMLFSNLILGFTQKG